MKVEFLHGEEFDFLVSLSNAPIAILHNMNLCKLKIEMSVLVYGE